MYKSFLLLFTTILFLYNCSVVFKSSLSGFVYDKEIYDRNPNDNNRGIPNAIIYLYLNEKDRDDDYKRYTNKNLLPDEGTTNKVKFFASTLSANNGAFSFSGLIWEEIFPKYGKSGDRKEVFFLIYHNNYGLQKNPYRTFIVSGVQNDLAPFILNDLLFTAKIKGRVFDYEKYSRDASGNIIDTNEYNRAALQNVSIDIFIPTNWSYTSDDTDGSKITNLEFKSTPDYTFTTDNEGKYEVEFQYKSKPASGSGKNTIKVLIRPRLNNYKASTILSSYYLNNLDLNKNGEIEENECYILSPIIHTTNNNYINIRDLDLLSLYNTSRISGYVKDVISSNGLTNVNVRIYIPELWSYDSQTNLKWVYKSEGTLTNPYFNFNNYIELQTDNDGKFTYNITYPKLKGTNFLNSYSDDKNAGLVNLILTFRLNNYFTDTNIDSKLIAASTNYNSTSKGLDIDYDGIPDTYYLTPLISKDKNINLPHIYMKRNRFSINISGRLWKDLNANNILDSDEGKNSAEVRLYFNRSNPPANNEKADYITTTRSREVGTQNVTIEKGYFSFNNLTFTNNNYSGSQASVNCYIDFVVDGAVVVDNYQISAYSDTDNYFEVKYN